MLNSLAGTVFQTAALLLSVVPRLRPGLLSLRSVLPSRQSLLIRSIRVPFHRLRVFFWTPKSFWLTDWWRIRFICGVKWWQIDLYQCFFVFLFCISLSFHQKRLTLHFQIRDGHRSSSDTPICFVRVFDKFALSNQRRAPLFERHPYLLRASLRQICTRKMKWRMKNEEWRMRITFSCSLHEIENYQQKSYVITSQFCTRELPLSLER